MQAGCELHTHMYTIVSSLFLQFIAVAGYEIPSPCAFSVNLGRICLPLKGNCGKVLAGYQLSAELVSILAAKYQVKKNMGLTAVCNEIIYLLSRYIQGRVKFLGCAGGL